MTRTRWLIHTLIGAMCIVPLVYLIPVTGEVSAQMTPFEASLQLPPTPVYPVFSMLRKLTRPVIAAYTVHGREDLWSICKRFGIDPFTIRSSNDLDVSIFGDGTKLLIPSQKGTLYEVDKPESLRLISQGYARGKALGAAYEREILEANGFPQPDMHDELRSFKPGTSLFLPQAFKPTGLQLPFKDLHYRQTSSFGSRRHPVSQVRRMHSGLDLAKPYGSPVLTSREGTVTFAGWMGGYGNMVEVRHVIKRKSGTRVLSTRYGHLSEILVHEGQHVRLYQLIGRVGSTGISTGPHLHFEVRDENGRASNPNNYL